MKAISSVNTVAGIANILSRPVAPDVAPEHAVIGPIHEQPRPQIKRPRQVMRDGYWLTGGHQYPYTNPRRGAGLGKDAATFLSRFDPNELCDAAEHVHAALLRIQHRQGAVMASDIQGILESWPWTRSDIRSIAEDFSLDIVIEANLTRELLVVAIYEAL